MYIMHVVFRIASVCTTHAHVPLCTHIFCSLTLYTPTRSCMYPNRLPLYQSASPHEYAYAYVDLYTVYPYRSEGITFRAVRSTSASQRMHRISVSVCLMIVAATGVDPFGSISLLQHDTAARFSLFAGYNCRSRTRCQLPINFPHTHSCLRRYRNRSETNYIFDLGRI